MTRFDDIALGVFLGVAGLVLLISAGLACYGVGLERGVHEGYCALHAEECVPRNATLR